MPIIDPQLGVTALGYEYFVLYNRQDGQGTSDELRSRDFRKELEEREHGVREKRDRERGRGNVLLNRGNVQLETRTRCSELIRSSHQ